MFSISLGWMLIFLLSLIIPPSIIFNTFVLLYWFIMVAFIFLKREKYSYFILVFIWAFTFSGVCCYFIEYGTYLTETQLNSFLSGATVRNLFLAATFIISSYCTFVSLNKTKLISIRFPFVLNTSVKTVFLAIFLFSLGCLIYIYIKYGTPSSHGVDRFYYWGNIAPEWGGYVRFVLSQLSIFIGYFYVTSKNRYFIILFVLSLAVQSLVGEKFSGLFISTLYFIIPILLFSRKSVFHFLFRFKKTIIFSSFIVFLLILSSYASIRSAGTSDALDALSTRILLQGQMWWAVDSVSDLGNLKNLAIIIHHYFGFGTEYEGQGMYYLMQQISPPEVFERYKNAGITFTMASPVNNIYFFGYYLSVIPVSIIGIFCGLSFWMLYRSFVVKDYILLFVAMKFYFMMFRVATMGDTGYLYSYKTVVYLLVIIFYCLMSGFKKRTFQ